MKVKRHASLSQIQRALELSRSFALTPGLNIEIVLPEARPSHDRYMGRKHRAYIRRCDTGQILVTAKSAYALLDLIQGGWKYNPDKREGLFE